MATMKNTAIFVILIIFFTSIEGASVWKECNDIPELNQTCVTQIIGSYVVNIFILVKGMKF